MGKLKVFMVMTYEDHVHGLFPSYIRLIDSTDNRTEDEMYLQWFKNNKSWANNLSDNQIFIDSTDMWECREL